MNSCAQHNQKPKIPTERPGSRQGGQGRAWVAGVERSEPPAAPHLEPHPPSPSARVARVERGWLGSRQGGWGRAQRAPSSAPLRTCNKTALQRKPKREAEVWNVGMQEYSSVGIAMDSGAECYRSFPPFHHSIIPLFHHSSPRRSFLVLLQPLGTAIASTSDTPRKRPNPGESDYRNPL